MVHLGHVHIHVSDLTRSRSFYAGKLGFEVGFENEGMVYFPAAGLIIDQAPGDARISPGTIIGLTCDDADTEYQGLEARGAPVEEPPKDQPWGVRNFYVTDPDGHLIEYEQPLDTPPPD